MKNFNLLFFFILLTTQIQARSIYLETSQDACKSFDNSACNIIVQSNYNGEGWTLNSVVEASCSDNVHFAPAVSEDGTTYFDGEWSWTGPNNFTATSRAIFFGFISADDAGVYTVTSTRPSGCVATQDFEIVYGNDCAPVTCLGPVCYEEIPQVAFDNFANAYNYTFWDHSFLTSITEARKFSIQTSSFGLNVNYDDLTIQSLNINQSNQQATAAFAASKASIFPADYGGNIDFAILQNGAVLHEKSPTPTSFGNADSQMAEYGTWLNRRFVSTYLTNNPSLEFYFTGVEFTNWHNRLKMTFHARPTATITNGQLRFSVEIPTVYNNQYTDGSIYAFADAADAGFSVKAGITATDFSLSGNTVTVQTAAQDLLANTSYEISLVFYAGKNNLSTNYTALAEEDAAISIQVNQTAPNQTAHPTLSYDADEGIHYLDIARYGMGYRNCGQVDVMQNIAIALENPSSNDKQVRLCFRQIPDVNVVGFNSLLRRNNGAPSGLPLQVSKNWHTDPQLFSGTWIREYTEIMVPANDTISFNYTRTGAKWGETYSVSSHQLSVVGSGIPKGGWLEAAMGSFGETVTHSPDYRFGNSNVCDYRPFLVTNEAYPPGTSTECNWTGNVGGMDMWVYRNDSNQRIHQKEVKTRFQRYSPNLSETSVSALSADGKLKWDYTFYLNRADDYVRVYYKIKIKALEDAPFNRFDIFQMGGDNYNFYKAQTVYYGNGAGTIGQFNPTNDGSDDYTTPEIAISGDDPWIWAGNGTITNGFGSINIETNNGIIVRDYQAAFGGAPSNTVYFRERSHSGGFSGSSGQNPTSYCLVTPPGINSFTAGDSVELLVETVILPKLNGDYYGPNTNFAAALAGYGNSVDLFLREVQGNKVTLSSPTNTVDEIYPHTITTTNNTALVTVTGGRSYVPLVFEGLDNVAEPVLWKSVNSSGNDCWEIVDQSKWGRDFWQADYQPETGLFDLIYNVNQDIPGDGMATISYYLGDTPPVPSIVVQTQYNDDPFTLNNVVATYLEDYVHFAPQVTEYGATSSGGGTWSWTGPNGFTSTIRNIEFPSVTEAELGMYTVTYTSVTGCTTTQTFEISCLETDANGICLIAACGGFVSTPYVLNNNHQEDAAFKTTTFIESTATVASGFDVDYIAGECILLDSGFEVVAGADFLAVIDSCGVGLLRLSEEENLD